MFVNDDDKAIGDYTVMTNRQGQKYTTSAIPSISGYSLNLSKLPTNGCGEFSDKDITVKYYYTKRDKDDTLSKVNIIYMSTDGEILGSDSISGELNAEYSTSELEFEGYALSSVTDNNTGVYDTLEQNVLYIYTPVSFTFTLICIIASVVGVIIVVGIIFICFKRKKKRLMNSLEIN
jgi:ABC-type antimicrobial peptide transport system permease subunit